MPVTTLIHPSPSVNLFLDGARATRAFPQGDIVGDQGFLNTLLRKSRSRHRLSGVMGGGGRRLQALNGKRAGSGGFGWLRAGAPSARSGSHLPQKTLGEVEQTRCPRDRDFILYGARSAE